MSEACPAPCDRDLRPLTAAGEHVGAPKIVVDGWGWCPDHGPVPTPPLGGDR